MANYREESRSLSNEKALAEAAALLVLGRGFFWHPRPGGEQRKIRKRLGNRPETSEAWGNGRSEILLRRELIFRSVRCRVVSAAFQVFHRIG